MVHFTRYISHGTFHMVHFTWYISRGTFHVVYFTWYISAPSPPSTGGVRAYSGSQLAPSVHPPDLSVISSVRGTLDSVKENVRRYVNTVRHKDENLEGIPEVGDIRNICLELYCSI